MDSFKYENMVKGWFVGGFSPSALKTDICEVAVKKYKAGEFEEAHYHKVATEVTMILSGKVRMVNREWCEGDIIVLEPGEITAFEALTDTINVVVKIPGALNDKFMVNE